MATTNGQIWRELHGAWVNANHAGRVERKLLTQRLMAGAVGDGTPPSEGEIQAVKDLEYQADALAKELSRFVERNLLK